MSFAALDSALLGPLFATETMCAVFSDEARLAALLRTEAALARAQAAIGLVPPSLAPAIERIGPDAFDMDDLGERTAISGVPIIPFVKALQSKLPDDLEPFLHKGATTQDIADTGLMLQLREGLDLVAADIRVVLDALARLARRHRDTPCAGRTYGQHAAPITFGFKAAIWAAGIADLASALPYIRQRICVASLAGPVGTLTALGERGPEVLTGFAEELGLGAPSVSWHVRRARLVETGTWLATLLGALAKMAADVVHLSSTEVGEVAEPHIAGRGGSSAMPHKRNPVSSTVILAAHAAAKGHVITLLDAMAAQHERPAGLWHAEWHALPPLFGLASGALREAIAIATGLTVDAERMRSNLDLTRGLLFADAAASRLSERLGREAAHALVERAAERVRAKGISLGEALRAMTEFPDTTDLDAAFDLTSAIRSAGLWTSNALADLERLQASAEIGATSACP
ncbi:adenylosuccinate lyase family protein [Mesorhizobium sp. VK24D]|uniref:Adenylosuccinate lyase family protein n=1 Tax=Mesorhizobium album TaxID=3072314 RepID=A0ABU4Y6Z1_9HYPH|nr:adenylosuccinate lyase family protein [Mesorhizobium sp. VK24D]MDX8482078.1 adenylosuccinate lyase family protein [Mesorhizobium sp. VK24D]